MSSPITLPSALSPAAIGYFKASNTNTNDQFGYSIALSADGLTLAVGALYEDGDATGINGSNNNNANDAGAVYVFRLTGTTWAQEAYVKAFNTGANDHFGFSVALSADGNTLAVGARQEDSDSTGVNNPDNNLRDNSGAAYVFTRSGTTWSQQAYIKSSNPDFNDELGTSLALSPDGNTLVVGSYREESNATGINGNQADNTVDESGAAYVFFRTGTTWAQQAYIKAADVGTNDHFSWGLALSSDGNTLAVGTHYEDSNAQGIGGDPSNNTGINSGAVYIYTRSGTTWSQQEYIKSSNSEGGDEFGWSVALTEDGNTLAVSARLENSAATGINGNQGSNGAASSGAIYIFSRSGATWTQDTYVKASNTGSGDHLGHALAISADGNRLVGAAEAEDSSAQGIGGNQADGSASAAGAVYVY